MKFEKAPESFDQQVNRLSDRGMVIPDRAVAVHYLGNLNYYRLSAYWRPFETDTKTHRFRPGTEFEDVLDLYRIGKTKILAKPVRIPGLTPFRPWREALTCSTFDRELRLLVMDAIERVEVSVRTRLSYELSYRHRDPHPHLDPELFHDKEKYRKMCAELENEAKKSSEEFARHMREKYDEPLPPMWAAVELMSFGQLSRWYANLRERGDRKAIAEYYGLDEKYLVSFLHHLNTIRNLCAHHSRLWNREITVTIKLPRRPAVLASSLNDDNRGRRRIYNTLVILAYLMDIISPRHHWKQRLEVLLGEHRIDIHRMGFPPGFVNRPIWDRR
jgi:abortive infection bacteriophage resistance protein